MKILLFSDFHAHSWNQFSTVLPNGRNSRFNDQLLVLSQIRDICVREEVDALFFLGDCFHSRTKIDSDVYSATWLAFRELSEVVDHFYILIGNHDQNTRIGDSHSLSSFGSFATIIDNPIIKNIAVKDDNVCFAAHPFTTEVKEWKAFAKTVKGADIFFGHQGLTGASIGAFEVYIKAEINSEDLPDTRYRYFGHYHKHQYVDARTAYIGSPLQLNFGERNEEKVFVLLDTKRNTVVNYPSNAPRFISVDFPNFDPSNYRMDRDFIRVSGLPHEVGPLKEKYPQIQIELMEVNKKKELRISPESALDDKKLLETYIQSDSKNPLDRNRLLDMGLEFLLGEKD